MRFYSLSARQLDYFHTVVTSVDACSHAESTGEDTVLNTFGTVVESGSRLSQFAVDAKRSEEGPAACPTKEASKTTGFITMPLIDTGSYVAGTIREPVALAAFFEEVRHISTKTTKI